MADDQTLNDKSKRAPKRVTGLGRGLNSLFGEIQREEPIVTAEADASEGGGAAQAPIIDGLRSIAVSDIRPNPDQPRQTFNTDALD